MIDLVRVPTQLCCCSVESPSKDADIPYKSPLPVVQERGDVHWPEQRDLGCHDGSTNAILQQLRTQEALSQRTRAEADKRQHIPMSVHKFFCFVPLSRRSDPRPVFAPVTKEKRHFNTALSRPIHLVSNHYHHAVCDLRKKTCTEDGSIPRLVNGCSPSRNNIAAVSLCGHAELLLDESIHLIHVMFWFSIE